MGFVLSGDSDQQKTARADGQVLSGHRDIYSTEDRPIASRTQSFTCAFSVYINKLYTYRLFFEI